MYPPPPYPFALPQLVLAEPTDSADAPSNTAAHARHAMMVALGFAISVSMLYSFNIKVVVPLPTLPPSLLADRALRCHPPPQPTHPPHHPSSSFHIKEPHHARGHAYARTTAAGISYTLLFVIKSCAVPRQVESEAHLA